MAVAEEHRQPTVTAHRDDLTTRVGQLGAERLGHRVRHRAVVERTDQPPPGSYLQVSTGPHGRHARIYGEYRVRISQSAERCRDVLRMDRRLRAAVANVDVELLTGLFVDFQRFSEVLIVGLFLYSHGETAHGEARVARDAVVEARATTELFGPLVDLNNGLVFGQILAIGEVGADQEDQIGVVQGFRAAAESDEAGKAHVERVVMLHDLLRAQRVTDGGLQAAREFNDLIVRLANAGTTEDRDPFVLVDQASDIVNGR
jgi:hypothetical protein